MMSPAAAEAEELRRFRMSRCTRLACYTYCGEQKRTYDTAAQSQQLGPKPKLRSGTTCSVGPVIHNVAKGQVDLGIAAFPIAMLTDGERLVARAQVTRNAGVLNTATLHSIARFPSV